jgi:hypothetical protein
VKNVVTGEIAAAKIIPRTTLTKPKARAKVTVAKSLFALLRRIFDCSGSLTVSVGSQLVSEIKIHRNLAHVNIVRLQEYVENDSQVILILDLCPDKVRTTSVKYK